MGKDKPVTLDIDDVLKHVGLDMQQFLLWKECQSNKTLQVNQDDSPSFTSNNKPHARISPKMKYFRTRT